MPGCRPLLRVVTLAAVAGAAACADAVGPDRSPDVLVLTGKRDSVVNTPPGGAPADTARQSSQLSGSVIFSPNDTLAPWLTVAGVRVEVGQRDAKTNTIGAVATATSDAAGHFAFEKLAVSPGLLYVRAVPDASTGYRATRWLAAYAFVGPSIVLSGFPVQATLGPYLVLERASAPPTDWAPVVMPGHVLGDAGATAVAGATVIVRKVQRAPGADSTAVLPDTPTEVVATARTDAKGFFLVTLPAPGLYAAQVNVPAGSPFKGMPLSRALSVSASAEMSVVSYYQIRLER